MIGTVTIRGIKAKPDRSKNEGDITVISCGEKSLLAYLEKLRADGDAIIRENDIIHAAVIQAMNKHTSFEKITGGVTRFLRTVIKR